MWFVRLINRCFEERQDFSTLKFNLISKNQKITLFYYEENKNNFVWIFLEKKKFESMFKVFYRYVIEKSFVKIDEYPAYPQVMEKMNCRHIINKHTIGLTNDYVQHTNCVEILWSRN